MKSKPSKFLDTLDTSEIYDDVVEKKALPELILKANILEAQDSLLLSERQMMNNFRVSQRFLKEDKVNFEGNLVLLWSFIRQMVEAKGVSKEDKVYYDILLRLEMGAQEIFVKDLIKTKNYLMKCLHQINITNLFQDRGKDYKSKVREL